MRKFCIGNAAASPSWSPGFKASKSRKRRLDKIGRANTPMVSWFPTLKGTPRMEGLRHYFHKHMAMLLDADPDVTEWTAQTTPVAFELRGEPVEFTPDFIVTENHRTRAVRLLRSGTTPSDKRQERHSAVANAYKEDGQTFQVLSQEELDADARLPAARALFVNRLRDTADDMPWTLAEKWGAACPVSLGEIHDGLGGGVEAWHQLLRMAAFGHLRLDFDGELTPATRVLACSSQGYHQ